MEIFYDPKFDVRVDSPSPYFAKQANTSLHHFIRNFDFGETTRILDVGGGNGESISKHLSKKHEVICIDQFTGEDQDALTFIKEDLESHWSDTHDLKGFNAVLALDVIEHMSVPEKSTNEIFKAMAVGGTLLASTANVSYVVLRIMHLFGWFNYGRKGILDLTHRRLFTIGTFKRLLTNHGFTVKKVIGFGPPIADLKSGFISKLLDRISYVLARIWPSMFAFNFLVIAERKEGFKDVCSLTTGKEYESANKQESDS